MDITEIKSIVAQQGKLRYRAAYADAVRRAQARLGNIRTRATPETLTEFAAFLENLHSHLHQAFLALEVCTLQEPGDSDIPPGLQEELAGQEHAPYVVCIVDGQLTFQHVTEPVVLDGINFGRFRINIVQDARTIWVEPLEPRVPHSGCTQYPHPHVHGSRVCLGDGGPAVDLAIREWRLQDAFAIIAAVLNTYNPRSPYHAIDNWRAPPCRNCGRAIQGEALTLDGRLYCSSCAVTTAPPFVATLRRSRQIEMPAVVVLRSRLKTCNMCRIDYDSTDVFTCARCGKQACSHCSSVQWGEVLCHGCAMAIQTARGSARLEWLAAQQARAQAAAPANPAQGTTAQATSEQPALVASQTYQCSCGASVQGALATRCQRTQQILCPICDPDETSLHHSVR